MHQPSRSRYDIAVVFVLSYLLISIQFSVGVGDDKYVTNSQIETTKSKATTKMINAVKTLFPLQVQTYYVHLAVKAKSIFRRSISYFAPPNLDFRGGGGGGGGGGVSRDEECVVAGEEGATEKVKEAVVKSLDKSKATVEKTAKSAARFAEEALDKSVKKVKKTLSKNEKVASDHEFEL